MSADDNNMKDKDPRSIKDLYAAFENADYIIRKRYRDDLDKFPVCPLPDELKDLFSRKSEKQEERAQGTQQKEKEQDQVVLGGNVQFFKVEKLVYDKTENTLDKLTTVYHTMSSFAGTSVLLVLHSDSKTVDIYLGVAERADPFNKDMSGNKLNAIKKAFEANFPGSTAKEILKGEEKDQAFVKKIFSDFKAVSCVTGRASLRDKDGRANEHFVQGIEKLIDAMQGEGFSAVFIADCKGISEIEDLCASYEDIYSALSPFAQSQQTLGETNGVTDTESLITSVTDTTNESVADTVTHSHTLGTSKSNTAGGNVGKSVGGGIHIGPVSVHENTNFGAHYSHTTVKSTSDTDSEGKTTTIGTAKSLTEQNSVAKSLATSTSEGLQINFQNRAVKTLMDRIDEQIKYLRSCEAYGVFDFGGYFLAGESATSAAAASIYDSLMRGDDSGSEVSAVNTWTDSEAEKIIEYLKRFYHPLIAVPNLSKEKDAQEANKQEKPKEYEITPVTPTTIISGKEIALHMGLPKKSVAGLPVIECAEFGRNVISNDGKEISGIELGKIYHMHNQEPTPVELDVDSLTMHTFITGSTGSGKSNTVYQLLKKLKDKGKHFLVVEPAKGEYKNVFGGNDGKVDVYGTNPDISRLLRINPFSFPEGIHVYEHMDRLVSIFNVCWPMYAAMPAVLKDAVERAYVDAGWDLVTSNNRYGRTLFPTFVDVLDQIEAVMDESQYSSDSKGDYKGALLTRVRSLTNGINGMIFGADELSDAALFDSNVIVDLSRVGSPETKSLIMGLLVMKLQEYRMANPKMTDHLKHVTVLEEAHNLLKRTSIEQSSETSNLVGKSVEMLSNAIAEMRAYGEGFIIADQAPGLLDMAVIRNTNTKIILRLPEHSDRELVGRAVGLNDDQIAELSKLKQGVAAVYQNDWVEAVLCQVEEYTGYDKKYIYSCPDGHLSEGNFKAELISRFALKDLHRLIDRRDWKKIFSADIPARVKCKLFDYINVPERDRHEIAAEVAYELLGGKSVASEVILKASFNEQKRYLWEKVPVELQKMTDEQFHAILSLIVYWHAHETERPEIKRLARELLQSECARRVE